jgi:hypothetical protein
MNAAQKLFALCGLTIAGLACVKAELRAQDTNPAVAPSATVEIDPNHTRLADTPPALLAKLNEVDDAVKSVAPTFGCYDPTNPKTCQQTRHVVIDDGDFSTSDFSSPNLHLRCFSPGPDLPYDICTNGKSVFGQIFNGTAWVEPPKSDPRCNQWGGPLSNEYLACEAALPPKQG